MPKQKFANFATSKLAASILATDTTINITAGDGVKFPVLAAGDYFMARIINSAKQSEIIKVTARATDQFTAARGQEGTTARAYTSGDPIQLILSRDLIAEFLTRNPPVAKSANYSTVLYDDGGFHELGTGVSQVTLGDAAVLRPTTADQWSLRLKNVSSANITIARTTGTDTINRAAANITLYPGQEVTFTVNAARNGFEVNLESGGPVNYAVASGTDTYTATLNPFAVGASYHVNFANTNTVVAPTLNGTTIKLNGGGALVAGNIPAEALLRYNGTDLILLNPKFKHRGCLAYASTASQPCASDAYVKMSYDAESYDTDAIHDNAVNPTRLTVPAGVTKIKLWASGNFISNSTGRRTILFYKNNVDFRSPGGTIVTDQANTSVVHYVRISTPVIAVVAGDYFEAVVYQNSGASLDIQNQQMSMEIVE